MNPRDAAVVAEALSRLSIARGGSPDARVGEVYLDALDDLDADLVRRACDALARQPRAEFESALPSVGAIRVVAAKLIAQDADAQALSMLLPAPKDEANGPRYFCLDCRDEPSGWRIFDCRGIGEFASIETRTWTPCGRTKEHRPHSFAERCHCAPYNPVSKAARDRMAVARQKRGESREVNR